MSVVDVEITPDPLQIPEGIPTGTNVATFNIVTTPPVLGPSELILLNDANGAFKLDGLDLIVADSYLIDFDLNPFLEITVIAGRCTPESIIKEFTIEVLDDDTLAPIITKVTPYASKGQALICVEGRFFTDGGSTTLLINGEEYPYVEDTLSDTNLCFNILGTSIVGPSIPVCEDISPFACGIFEFTICNGNTDGFDTPLCDSDLFIRYTDDQTPSLVLGNTQCVTKATIAPNIDIDTPIGGFNSLNINWVPNSNTMFVQVRVKYDFRYDVAVGGAAVLDNIDVIDGDLVWLTNQGTEVENGIWIVRDGPWEYDMEVTDDVFVDLGASGFDPDIGNISRDIITTVNPGGTLDDSKHMLVDWGTVGIYSIDYYYLTTECVLSESSRKVRVFDKNASISPVNTFAITDYRIFNGFDQDLINNIIPSGSDDVCCPGFIIPQSGLYIRKDGSVVFMADQCMGDNTLTNLAFALNDGDAVPIQQLMQSIAIIPSISVVFTAGEDINVYDVVRMDIDGLIYKADSSDLSHINSVTGISTSLSLIGDEVVVTVKGTVTGPDGILPLINNFTSLVQGREYWLSTEGELSLNPPLTGFSQVIGIATSCNTFILNPQIPIVL